MSNAGVQQALQKSQMIRNGEGRSIDRETFQKVQEEMARRSSLRKTSSKAKTELARYSGKYALNEILVCGECGSPYRRKLWIQNGERRYVWRCLNRLEYGRKLCRHSPTLDEAELHLAITSAMNEMFQMHAAKQVLTDSITAALAGEEQELTLPAVESRIQSLQERQMELFQLAVSAGSDCTEYDEEIQRVNSMTSQCVSSSAISR